ncbi:MAG: hypothetical protein QOD72_2390 [Acidimicrobiaceae bacterium]|nr:hypothetical protein [Acidimicrobiaceae bacterium]
MARWRSFPVVLVVVMASCSSTASPPSSSSPGTSATAEVNATTERTVPLGRLEGLQLGATGCDPASPVAGVEVRGTSASGELYGLIMAQRLPIRPGDEVKIVWRMTGVGDLRTTFAGPDGHDVALAWGPEAHGGSNYSRPGDEWGTGYVFSQPGCWHLGFRRDDTAGDVWLQIEP